MLSIFGRGLSKVLFPVPEAGYTCDSFPGELIWIPNTSDNAAKSVDLEQHGGRIPCLFHEHPSARFIVVYFHCNGEDLGGCHSFCAFFREQFQVHVLAVEFPGYGLCPGKPSPETIKENAQSAIDFIRNDLRWQLKDVLVFGRSLGTGPALAMAGGQKLGGVILVAPFLSIEDMIRERIGSFAAGLVLSGDFRNKDVAQHVKCPTFIVHGQADSTIPCEHSKALYALIGTKKILVMPGEMDHNSSICSNIQHFILPVFRFFSLPQTSGRVLNVPDWCRSNPKSGSQAAPIGAAAAATACKSPAQGPTSAESDGRMKFVTALTQADMAKLLNGDDLHKSEDSRMSKTSTTSGKGGGPPQNPDDDDIRVYQEPISYGGGHNQKVIIHEQDWDGKRCYFFDGCNAVRSQDQGTAKQVCAPQVLTRSWGQAKVCSLGCYPTVADKPPTFDFAVEQPRIQELLRFNESGIAEESLPAAASMKKSVRVSI